MRIWWRIPFWYSERCESSISKYCGTASAYSRRFRCSVASRHSLFGGRYPRSSFQLSARCSAGIPVQLAARSSGRSTTSAASSRSIFRARVEPTAGCGDGSAAPSAAAADAAGGGVRAAGAAAAIAAAEPARVGRERPRPATTCRRPPPTMKVRPPAGKAAPPAATRLGDRQPGSSAPARPAGGRRRFGHGDAAAAAEEVIHGGGACRCRPCTVLARRCRRRSASCQLARQPHGCFMV